MRLHNTGHCSGCSTETVCYRSQVLFPRLWFTVALRRLLQDFYVPLTCTRAGRYHT